ncbi:hypothetical protein DL95DRAFT_400868 [Leptodontidium sp. 2 PMI_412]|nr:hypothetical protein DL95DRAFT_400868 [Leptodontidium sp. 2 PMI_412]
MSSSKSSTASGDEYCRPEARESRKSSSASSASTSSAESHPQAEAKESRKSASASSSSGVSVCYHINWVCCACNQWTNHPTYTCKRLLEGYTIIDYNWKACAHEKCEEFEETNVLASEIDRRAWGLELDRDGSLLDDEGKTGVELSVAWNGVKEEVQATGQLPVLSSMMSHGWSLERSPFL